MSNLPSLPSSNKPKSFWDKPEGLWGMILALPIGAGVLWFFSWFIPFMLSLALGILGLVIIGTVITGLLAFLFTNNPLRQAVVLKYQVFCKKLRSSIISENPIAILRLLQSKARKRLDEFSDLMNQVGQARRKTDMAAKQFTKNLEMLYSQISLARSKGDVENENRYLTRAGKTEKYRDNMTALTSDVERMTTMLNKAKTVCENIIDDAEFEISNEETSLSAVTAVDGAWGKLRTIFKGNGDDNELRSEAMRCIADEMSEKLGRVDNYMEEFKSVMANMDNMDEINAETARRKMAEMEQGYVFEPRQGSQSSTAQPRAVTNNPSPTLPTYVSPSRVTQLAPPPATQVSPPQARNGIRIERH